MATTITTGNITADKVNSLEKTIATRASDSSKDTTEESITYIIEQMTVNKIWFNDTLYKLASDLKSAHNRTLRLISYLNLLYAQKKAYGKGVADHKTDIEILKNLNGDRTGFSRNLEPIILKNRDLAQNIENEIQNTLNKIQTSIEKENELLGKIKPEFEKHYVEQDDKERKKYWQKWNDPKWWVFKKIHRCFTDLRYRIPENKSVKT